jgi:hypothetical protein
VETVAGCVPRKTCRRIVATMHSRGGIEYKRHHNEAQARNRAKHKPKVMTVPDWWPSSRSTC